MLHLLRRVVKTILPAKAVHAYRVLRHIYIRPFEPEIRIAPKFFDRTKIGIDVGANVGVFTSLLARYSKKVIAFEPNPHCADHLQRISLRNCEVVQKAVSDQAGFAVLRVPVGGGGEMHALSTIEAGNTLETVQHVEGEVEYSVETVSLDDELERRLTPGDEVGFIKIDVEGHELAVLRGAERTLAQHRPVLLIELEFRHGADVAASFVFLRARGYRALALVDGRSLVPIDAEGMRQLQTADDLQRKLERSTDRGYVNNVFFLPIKGSALGMLG